MAVGGLDVPVPELVRQSKPGSKTEDDVGVRARLAARRHDRRSWISDCASWLISKPIFNPSRSKAEATAGSTPGHLGRRVHEQIRMGVEIQRRQRLAPANAVGMGQQHVRTEADHGADGVRRPPESPDRDPAPTYPESAGPSGRSARPTVGAIGRAAARSCPLSGAAGWRREQDVATRPFERAVSA